MRLGISSWTFPWAIGVAGQPSPTRPIRLVDLLAKASDLKVEALQVADNLPLEQCDVAELREARAQARQLGLLIEIGTRGVYARHLRNYLRVADEVGARLIRTLVSGIGSPPTLEEAEISIREVLPEFEAQGVTLAIENYEAHSCRGLANLVHKLDSRHVGVCLDTANSLGAMETLPYVVETLGPLTVNLHIKDFVVERATHKMGFVVKGARAGTGCLDIPWLIEKMPPKEISVVLEQWPPFTESVEATIAMEQEWAELGIRHLRSCVCSQEEI